MLYWACILMNGRPHHAFFGHNSSAWWGVSEQWGMLVRNVLSCLLTLRCTHWLQQHAPQCTLAHSAVHATHADMTLVSPTRLNGAGAAACAHFPKHISVTFHTHLHTFHTLALSRHCIFMVMLRSGLLPRESMQQMHTTAPLCTACSSTAGMTA